MIHDDPQAYENLLAALRKDLLLDPSVDCIPPGLVSAQGLPWKVDAGTVVVTFAGANQSTPQTVPHRIGRTPLVFLQPAATNFIGTNVASASASNFVAQAFDTLGTVITASFTLNWVAIG